MFRATRAASTFSGENGAARLIQWIGEGDGAFGIDEFMSVAGGALLVFTAFEIFPRLEIVSSDEEFFRNLLDWYEEFTQRTLWSVVDGLDSACKHLAVLHYAGFLES